MKRSARKSFDCFWTQSVEVMKNLMNLEAFILKYSLNLQFLIKMFDQSQKWSGHTKKSCKFQCANYIYMVGFIKKYINISKSILQGFLWKFNFKSQINNFLTKKKL